MEADASHAFRHPTTTGRVQGRPVAVDLAGRADG
jgi:hypothetical protein